METLQRDEVRRGPAGPVRVLWRVFAAVLVIGALAGGTYNLITLLAHEEHTEVSVHPAGVRAVDVRSSAGSVRIEAGDVPEIEVTAEISDGLRATGESQRVVDGVLQLRATCPNFGSDWCRVDYTVIVPADVDVTVRADDGSVDVVGVTGAVDVDNDNGSIDLVDLTGPVAVANDNGRITAVGLASATVDADNDNGRIELTFVDPPQTVVGSNDNGSIEVVVPDAGVAYDVALQSDNGSTTIEVPTDPDSPRTITLQTDNGDLAVLTAR